MLLSKIIYIAFLFFFTYFILLTVFYAFLAFIGFIEGGRRTRESEEESYPLVYLSTIAIPVSIIIPARNEEGWIRDSVSSVLNLNYPKFEVVIVDDGSTDKTLKILDEMLQLTPTDTYYIKHYKDGKVRDILRSKTHPNVRVITKDAGTKKAGAVNAGLNIAKNDYVCVIDSDTVLEPDGLLKVMAEVEKDPDRVIGIGSYFGLSNGLKIKNGRVEARTFSYNPIIAYQHLEYIRSFIGNRIAWSKYNAMPVVAGGFAVWRRDILYELGGFSTTFTCEDIELTFRMHDYMAKNRANKYRVVMLPHSVGWTEGPSDVGSLILQRNRWQRVTNETIWKYKYMLCNPHYGGFAFLTLPYFVVYEVLGVFFEWISIALVGWGWIKGVLDIRTFAAFLLLMIASQITISLLSIMAFLRCRTIFKLRYMAYVIFLSFFEFFIYRWMVSLAKLMGTVSYLAGNKSFSQYARAKRAT